jgi:acylphosphatase
MDESGWQVYTYDVHVRGYVQGVGYRAFVYREAGRLGVSGWVRNEPDGSVRLVLQHSRTEALEALVSKLQQGPALADITGVDVLPLSTEERFVGMEIR